MKVGCCALLEDKDFLLNQEFDFTEIPAHQLKDNKNMEKVYSVNCFLPRDKSIYVSRDHQFLKLYAKKIIELAAQHDIEIITLGSGHSRKTTSNNPTSIELNLWSNFIKFIDGIAKENGVKIALEPLNKKETNFLNTPNETAQWINNLHLESTGITIDSYHYYSEHSSLEEAKKYSHMIVHAHISDSNQQVPSVLDNKLIEFIKLVKKIGCNLSVEAVPYDRELLSNKIVQMIKEVINNG